MSDNRLGLEFIQLSKNTAEIERHIIFSLKRIVVYRYLTFNMVIIIFWESVSN